MRSERPGQPRMCLFDVDVINAPIAINHEGAATSLGYNVGGLHGVATESGRP